MLKQFYFSYNYLTKSQQQIVAFTIVKAYQIYILNNSWMLYMSVQVARPSTGFLIFAMPESLV